MVHTSGGEGEAEVAARLRSTSSGRTFTADRRLSLRDHDVLQAVIDVPSPPGTYAATVTMAFPIE